MFTLLLPWSGWKLVQELEQFLRDAQETKLLTQARVVARSIPLQYQSRMLFAPDRTLRVRELPNTPIIDGYNYDWPDAGQGMDLASADGLLSASVLAGDHAGQLFLFIEVYDPTPIRAGSIREVFITEESIREGIGQGAEQDQRLPASDGVVLFIRSPRGLQQFRIHSEAPGPLQLQVGQGSDGQASGYWLETEKGYRLELALPALAANADLSIGIIDVYDDPADHSDQRGVRLAGTVRQNRPGSWISLQSQWTDLSAWLSETSSGLSQTWLVDGQGWVLADSGRNSVGDGQAASWAQRLIYRLVAGSRTQIAELPQENRIQIDDGSVLRAMSGEESILWTQDLSTAVVTNTVTVPVEIEGRIMGAVIAQSATDGLLLVTNRALGRLLFTTLALTFGLALGLWYFATRLSRRVSRLSSAVSVAMHDGVELQELPLISDRDELGELSRNNQKLLRAVAEYNQYLQTLAGKLSHELKTPLAITRSSLDNLAEEKLDSRSRQFLVRAQEGLERQSAIVRAMSEANRLEQAIKAADWERADIAALVRRCVEGYRSVYPGRDIAVNLPGNSLFIRCAPDLLAQALDKLVDNAVSLTHDSERIAIRLESASNEVVIRVSNSGSRLPDEYQDRLFDSLVSLREKRGRAPHLGLGLYIVRLVTMAHGGSVTARNLPGDLGVEFSLTLPHSQ